MAVAHAGAHVLMLGAYTDFGPQSHQVAWLKADLAAISRAKTPSSIACGPT